MEQVLCAFARLFVASLVPAFLFSFVPLFVSFFPPLLVSLFVCVCVFPHFCNSLFPCFLPCCPPFLFPSCLLSLLPCFLPPSLPSFLPSSLPPSIPSSLPSLPSLPPSLPSCLPSFLLRIAPKGYRLIRAWMPMVLSKKEVRGLIASTNQKEIPLDAVGKVSRISRITLHKVRRTAKAKARQLDPTSGHFRPLSRHRLRSIVDKCREGTPLRNRCQEADHCTP